MSFPSVCFPSVDISRGPASVLDTVGRTPLLRLSRILPERQAAVFVKAECQNPLASVKDRIGLAMIEAAERGATWRSLPGWRCSLAMPARRS